VTALKVSLRGDREIAKLLDSLSGTELVNRTRRATRAGAAVMRTDLRARARSGKYPKTFQQIATRSSTRGGIKTQVGPTSPLHNIFEGGADTHEIAPTSGGAGILSNLNKRDRAASSGNWTDAFFARGPVSHPGMAARPLTTPAFEATKDDATKAAMDKLLEGIH